MTIITGRRVLVTPWREGPTHLGSPGSVGVDAYAVPLLEDYLRSVGGSAYRVGEQWTLNLMLCYVDSSLDLQPVPLTGLGAAVLTVYRRATADVIATRTLGAEIEDGLAEMEFYAPGGADPAPGVLTVRFGASETPTPGVHVFRLVFPWTSTPEVMAAGRIEVLPSTPSSS